MSTEALIWVLARILVRTLYSLSRCLCHSTSPPPSPGTRRNNNKNNKPYNLPATMMIAAPPLVPTPTRTTRRPWFAWAILVTVLLAAWGPPGSCGFSITPPPPPQSPDYKLAARRLGEIFVDAILNNPFETLPNKEGGEGAPGVGEMRLWRDIPDLETLEDIENIEDLEDLEVGKGLVNIVLRSIVEPFWQSCIDRVEAVFPNHRYRVCAVGTPGIGKTFTTPLLLRMLLLNNSSVVYIRRTEERDSWFYEFIPTSDGKNPYVVNVYPEESTKFRDIPSLRDPSAYYVVDPGESQVSCNPKPSFKARVIIISSPNDRHWGAGEFVKRRGNQLGTFRYYPLWNLNEVLCGLDFFNSDEISLSPQKLAERYRQVGGVPRHLFADMDEYKDILDRQKRAVKAVNSEQAMDIVSGEIDTDGLLDSKSPKSAVIGIELADNDHGAFTERKAVPISAVAAEQVFLKHITTLWNDMVANERPLVFESYLRTVLTNVEIDVSKLTEQGTATSPRSAPPSKIGGYSGIQIVSGGSIVKAAIESPTANILFYSSNQSYPLIDFACKDSNGTILAFQATTGPRHDASKSQIADLEDQVGERGLMLYYLHADRSGGFKTDPVKPKTRFCRIFHVKILKPDEETLSEPEAAIAEDDSEDE